MSSYTNQQIIEGVLQRELTDDEERVLESAIEAVSESIKAYTGRNWLDLDETTADEEVRYYDGNGKREIFIDDFTSISQIRFLDSLGTVTNTVPTTSYTYYPPNTEWKNSIYLRDRYFPNIRSGVEITGVFYTGEVPIDVQMACATLVGHFFASSRNVGDFKKESIEGYSYEILTGDEKTAQDKATLDKIDYWRKVSL
jgi:hypothetical protein